MKHCRAHTLALASVLVIASAPAHAQFSRLLDSVKDRVERKAVEQVDRMVDGEPSRADAGQPSPSRMLQVDMASDFVPGDHVLLHDTFAGVHAGAMPGTWRTNGSAQVMTVQQVPGQWLDMRTSSLFKLATPLQLPERFTIEFELLAIADSIGDLYPVEFGFAHDGSVARSQQINAVRLHYYNDGGVVVTSRATDHYTESGFDLRGYANRVMPVAIAVDGDQMRVYLDGHKISDARLFRDNASRHFYIESPSRLDNGSHLALGNIRIATFSGDLVRATP
ncbi:hypothetical protein LY625_11120 [Lysobacter sp. GX 14042]|uniref:hypothetical protein n=1 Tax=Lysobacter sp. GX 14042 TaxID=2907155 RepID=UPI001F425E83|nr:hypothetical protein [Lysobacter sp. GX 14042]MCE7033158.1 hypothetical protein [Lysobacter sp. GX 14042]